MIQINDCSCGKRCEGNTDQCASCNARDRKAAKIKGADNVNGINNKSEKQSYWDRKYFAKLKTWKRGKKCAAKFPHDCSDALECHHMYSRSVNAYHDEWARENEIPELLDDRFWLPVCPDAHRYLTDHSDFAWANGYSFKRVSDPIFQKKDIL